MLKHLLAGCCLALVGSTAAAQTLFYYGKDSVSVQEFMQAYRKNNAGVKNPASLRHYLDLYTAARLKIHEARERGYDTLPQLAADLQSLREQLVPGFLKDEAGISRLTDEAGHRAQKDIRLAHIFLSFTKNGLPDTTAALRSANEALGRLQQGESFATVARRYSDDPSVAVNGGDLGYITVFSLPYALENLAYQTPVGKIAPLYRSKAGYHIVKNVGERPALGSIKAAQILLAFPPEADEATREALRQRADSLYQRLQQGDDFGQLAAQFSNDAVSAPAGGQLPPFGIGQYAAAFENTVFGLARDGAISRPFATDFGYHIVKRIERLPVAGNLQDPAVRDALREKVEQSDRIQTTREALAQKILKEAGFRQEAFTEAALQAYTDSLLDYKQPAMPLALKATSPLFHIGDQAVTAEDWTRYAQVNRYKADGSGTKPHQQVWNEFVHATALEYYGGHLEQYNEAFRQQLNEFREGNLFFEIMQREVWNRAQTDTAALLRHYEQNKKAYTWKQSADAVIFYAADAATARLLRQQLQKAPENWKGIAESFSEKAVADSGRFELSQLPGGAGPAVKKGTITATVVNEADQTASFALIVRTYSKPEQRNFAAAKGLVVSDYQAALEKAWVNELKKKYPVRMNEQALARLAER